MTDHPCKGLTKTQREAFERVAINQHPQCGWKSIDALVKRGVIARGADDIRRDAMGTYTIPNYYVPLHVHYQWCNWCSEQSDIEDVAS